MKCRFCFFESVVLPRDQHPLFKMLRPVIKLTLCRSCLTRSLVRGPLLFGPKINEEGELTPFSDVPFLSETRPATVGIPAANGADAVAGNGVARTVAFQAGHTAPSWATRGSQGDVVDDGSQHRLASTSFGSRPLRSTKPRVVTPRAAKRRSTIVVRSTSAFARGNGSSNGNGGSQGHGVVNGNGSVKTQRDLTNRGANGDATGNSGSATDGLEKRSEVD